MMCESTAIGRTLTLALVLQTSPDSVIPFAQWNASLSNVQEMQQDNPFYTPAKAKTPHKHISSAGIALIVIGCLLVAAAVGAGSWYALHILNAFLSMPRCPVPLSLQQAQIITHVSPICLEVIVQSNP